MSPMAQWIWMQALRGWSLASPF